MCTERVLHTSADDTNTPRKSSSTVYFGDPGFTSSTVSSKPSGSRQGEAGHPDKDYLLRLLGLLVPSHGEGCTLQQRFSLSIVPEFGIRLNSP